MMKTDFSPRAQPAAASIVGARRIGLNLMLAACLFSGAVVVNPTWADQPTTMRPQGEQMHGMPDMSHHAHSSEHWAKIRAERKRHLDVQLHEMANRLQITAAQEPVWQEYIHARTAMMPERIQRPREDMNAAEIARFRAERMKAMAERMTLLSTATANLRHALDENQRKVLDDAAQRFGHRARHGSGQKCGRPFAYGPGPHMHENDK